MTKFQIDQSGKIEDTGDDTILALAGGDFSYTLKITRKVKREVQQYFRKQGEPSLFVYKTFAVGVFILLNAYNARIDSVTIDREYPGHERPLSEMLNRLFVLYGVCNKLFYSFSLIGKTSVAHAAAHKVFTRRLGEDKRLECFEIKKIASYLSDGLVTAGR